jgi:cell division protein FtsI (penicillin-binding protein 3)
MVLAYKGLTPSGTRARSMAELASTADPAMATMALMRKAQGRRPPVQEVLPTRGRVKDGSVRVPDMTGWPIRDAVRRTINLGLAPKVHGSGLLARQQPPPGRIARKGEQLLLVFEPAT